MEDTDVQEMPKVSRIFSETMNSVLGFIRKEMILRGVLFLLLGLLMMFRPGQTLVVITVAIGCFIFLDGISMLLPALKYHGKNKAILVLNAVVFILLGLFTCTAPLKMDVIWVIMIGCWQLFNGIHCLGFRSSAGNSALLSGIFGILAGLLLITMPIFGMMTLMWIMGIISCLAGITAILFGIRLKKILQ